jgi:hypothetical protein
MIGLLVMAIDHISYILSFKKCCMSCKSCHGVFRKFTPCLLTLICFLGSIACCPPQYTAEKIVESEVKYSINQTYWGKKSTCIK